MRTHFVESVKVFCYLHAFSLPLRIDPVLFNKFKLRIRNVLNYMFCNLCLQTKAVCFRRLAVISGSSLLMIAEHSYHHLTSRSQNVRTVFDLLECFCCI